MKIESSRRGFLRGVAGLAALGAGGCLTARRGEKVKLAIVGIWGKGYADWTFFMKHGKVEIVALCDCDRNMLPIAQAELRKDGFDLDKGIRLIVNGANAANLWRPGFIHGGKGEHTAQL